MYSRMLLHWVTFRSERECEMSVTASLSGSI